MIQEPEDILDNIEMHLIDTFDRRLRAMEILKIFIDNGSVVKENELLHSVIYCDCSFKDRNLEKTSHLVCNDCNKPL